MIGYYRGKAGEEILDTYATIRRDIFLNYIDTRSTKNLNRVWKADPWTVLYEDKFFGIIKELIKDKAQLKEFLLKTSSIEYDFTKHYNDASTSNGHHSNETSRQTAGTKFNIDAQLLEA